MANIGENKGNERPKDGIYLMDELDETLAGTRPSEMASLLSGEDGERFDVHLPYFQITGRENGSWGIRSLGDDDENLPRFPDEEAWKENLSKRAFHSLFNTTTVRLNDEQYKMGAKEAAKHSDFIPYKGHYACSECRTPFLVDDDLLKEAVAEHMLHIALYEINDGRE